MIADKQTERGANWGGRTEMRGGFDERRLGFIRASYAHQTLYFCLDSINKPGKALFLQASDIFALGPQEKK
jgi:hypothetical protein